MTYQQPNKDGFFGEYGGRFVPETLMTAVLELEQTYRTAKEDPEFQAEFEELLVQYVGRENPLYFAKRLTDYCGGAKIYLKREDLNHTGAHKINNSLGQVLLAKRMGKKKIIAEKEGRVTKAYILNQAIYKYYEYIKEYYKIDDEIGE